MVLTENDKQIDKMRNSTKHITKFNSQLRLMMKILIIENIDVAHYSHPKQPTTSIKIHNF